MRLTPSDTVDHVDLNRSFRRPSSSHEGRILRRNLPPPSFCENFVLAVFSTFSTVSAKSRHQLSAGLSRDASSLQGTQCILNDRNNCVARHSAGGWQSFG